VGVAVVAAICVARVAAASSAFSAGGAGAVERRFADSRRKRYSLRLETRRYARAETLAQQLLVGTKRPSLVVGQGECRLEVQLLGGADGSSNVHALRDAKTEA
jgi:hypothetical protein